MMFEIKSGDEIGVFEVSAKFMGVAMEKVELVFQVGLKSTGLLGKISVRISSFSSSFSTQNLIS